MFDVEDGFFHAFTRAGAAAVVAPLWSVVSYTAGKIALDIYTALARGVPLPEAVRQARCVPHAEPDRLAYVVYCHPDCRRA